MKKAFLQNSQKSQENTCASVSFLIKLQGPATLLQKETLAEVLSCEFCEISKNTFFTEHLWATASIELPTILENISLENIMPLLGFYSDSCFYGDTFHKAAAHEGRSNVVNSSQFSQRFQIFTN